MISPKSHSTVTLTEIRTEAMERFGDAKKKDLKARVADQNNISNQKQA